ncbi:MAG TPA: thioredoxin, partial [Planctomycetaceae bacterium]|nr:thioredoxin [Planctomycetaceae bacterium]
MSRFGKKWRLQLALAATLLPTAATAQEPSDELVRALSFKPRQAGVNYEKIPESQFGECKVETKSRQDGSGFLVTGPAGQPLRWFVDTDGDKRLDRWCFFNAGVEVYRESDLDGDRRADEYRWLSTEGIRKGTDDDGDGVIDAWQVISAEEVTAEIVKATASVSEPQFQRLLITPAELEQLGLGDDKREEIERSVRDAREQFADWARGQSVVTRNTRWMHFGADKPGLVPEGTDGSTQDVVVYENVVALLEDNDEPRQLLVGTMVKVEDRWRLIGLPSAVNDGQELSERGRFFSATFTNRNDAAPTVASGMTKALERLVKQLQEVDEDLLARDGDLEQLNAQRADILEKMVVEAPNEQERQQWIQQMADTVNAAAQTGEYEGGVQRLVDFARRLKAEGAADDDVAYVSYRALEAQHRVAMLSAKEDEFDKIQQRHIESLEGFVDDFADSPEAAEAMTQLALDAEFSGDSDRAKDWYGKASQSFGDTVSGEKAAG